MCLVAGGLVLSLAVPAPTNAATSAIPIPTTPFTGFGGYNSYETVTSISGQWVVPTILNDKPGVSASTWIGAQSASDNAFVQIGTIEDRFASGPPVYEAFWSDTALHFNAQLIRAVGTKDSVSASMTQLSTGWVLHIADLTENWSRNIRTTFADHTLFSDGQWLQEDPPPSLNSALDLPYPVTTLVQFTGVEVDGHVPLLSYENAQALSGNGGIFLVPTAFTDDSFALPPAQGAAKQYLADAARFDTRLYQIDLALAAAHEPLSYGQQRTQAAKVVDVLSGFSADVLHQSWPASAGADIQQLVRNDTRISNDYRAAEKAGFQDSASQTRRFVLDLERFHADVETTRAQLGLPPT
jgi:hypothetical protein